MIKGKIFQLESTQRSIPSKTNTANAERESEGAAKSQEPLECDVVLLDPPALITAVEAPVLLLLLPVEETVEPELDGETVDEEDVEDDAVVTGAVAVAELVEAAVVNAEVLGPEPTWMFLRATAIGAEGESPLDVLANQSIKA